MTRRLSFHAMAEQELNDAAGYYQSVRAGLGDAFLNEVERAIAQIAAHPEAAPLISRTVRKKLVARFPYNIMYSVTRSDIRILAIANQKRRPFYWRGRR
jgi:plasmid stabilization system protein ParE